MYCFIFNIIFINIVIFLINYSTEVTAKNVNDNKINDNAIRIIIKKPQHNEKQYSEENLLALKNHFISSNVNNTLLNNYKLEFHYCSDVYKAEVNRTRISQRQIMDNSIFLKDKEYVNYLQCIIDSSYSQDYDLLLLDDRFLFSDTSLIENIQLEDYFNFRHIYKNYLNLTTYINLQELEYHNPKVVKDGMLDKYSLYGLPFELDFDLLYYHNEVQQLENLSPEKLTWEKLLDPNFPDSTSNSNSKFKSLFGLPLGDNNELLNLFIEYFSDKKNLTTERIQRKADYFDKKKENDNIFVSFKNFVEKSSNSDIDDILGENFDTVLTSFINKENKVMKGKASHFAYLKSLSNITVSSTLPPKYFSAITEKYLVINNHSLKEKKLLVEVAKQLTSKEMQLYRAQNFEYIPTLDVTRDDPDIKNYCSSHSFFCHSIQQMEPIHMKSMFEKTKYKITFLEIRLLLPEALKQFLRDGDVKSIAITFDNIMNVKMYNIGSPNIYFTILFVIMAFFVIYMIIILFLVYKYRDHPYLKVISAIFCMMALIGLISNAFTPILLTHITSSTLCKFIYIHGIVSRTLIFMPLFAVVFRIFCIYTNKSKVSFGKKLDDKRLFIGIISILLVGIVIGGITIYFREFYIITIGNITDQVALRCYHKGTLSHIIFGFIYYSLIVSIITVYVLIIVIIIIIIIIIIILLLLLLLLFYFILFIYFS